MGISLGIVNGMPSSLTVPGMAQITDPFSAIDPAMTTAVINEFDSTGRVQILKPSGI